MRRVLEALRSQALPFEKWELLLIDNASFEHLEPVWDISWHPNARHVRENELGLAHARECGMREAAAEILVFVDDDNVLNSDYLSEVVKIGRKWPRLGIWGSNSISGEFEFPPPSNVLAYLPYLALRDAGTVCWSNVATCRQALPCGAGLCVRSDVAKAYLQVWDRSSIKITGRRGTSLQGGRGSRNGTCSMRFGMGYGTFS